ncbi:hypothetical protein GA0070619_1337 [Micromonospora zamorensis]|nr:hypothetical protein GA0070619_1337 [Micromonospora zamorensis]
MPYEQVTATRRRTSYPAVESQRPPGVTCGPASPGSEPTVATVGGPSSAEQRQLTASLSLTAADSPAERETLATVWCTGHSGQAFQSTPMTVS